MLNHLSGIQTGFAELEKTLKGEPLTEQLSEITFTDDRQFRYDNINYHLLGIILSRVYQQPLNQVIDNKLWRPLNLEKADIIDQHRVLLPVCHCSLLACHWRTVP